MRTTTDLGLNKCRNKKESNNYSKAAHMRPLSTEPQTTYITYIYKMPSVLRGFHWTLFSDACGQPSPPEIGQDLAPIRPRFYLRLGMCYKHRAAESSAKYPPETDARSSVVTDQPAPSLNEGLAAAALVQPLAPGDDISHYCPVCSQRLISRHCKLMCTVCGYYMSCARLLLITCGRLRSCSVLQRN
jgi:hypothetical protein